MKRVIAGIALGAAAGVIGIIGYELSDQQIVGWLITGCLLGIASQSSPLTKWRWLLWGGVGGGIILISWALNTLLPYPTWVAWPLLGAVFGCLVPRSEIRWRISGGAIGLLAGGVGIGILPLITLVILPALSLPTTFDYDIDVLGLMTTGAFIGGTIAWLKVAEGKNTKKRKKGVR
jgi:hypothetical protein